MTKTFIQTTTFEKQWKELGFADDDLCRLEYEIMKNPQVGRIVPGTGRLRKMRFATQNSGKRGGARVCYVDFVVLDTIYLFFAYGKRQKENLTQEECHNIKKTIDVLEKKLMREA